MIGSKVPRVEPRAESRGVGCQGSSHANCYQRPLSLNQSRVAPRVFISAVSLDDLEIDPDQSWP